VVKCAPPENKPERTEATRCAERFLVREMQTLKNVRVILPLGGFALKWLGFALKEMKIDTSDIEVFGHGNVHEAGPYKILTSYHVSPMNTYNGKLTESMSVEVLKQAKEIV
jgi:uracil-DNA glycosylase